MARQIHIGGLEVAEVPHTYLKPQNPLRAQPPPNLHERRQHPAPTGVQRFLYTLLHARIPYALRLHIDRGKAHAFHVTTASSEEQLHNRLVQLSQAFQAHFPAFRTRPAALPPPVSKAPTPLILALVTGVPRFTPHPLDALASILTGYPGTAVFQAWVTTASPGFLYRAALRRRYQSVLRDARAQHSSPSGLFSTTQVSREHINLDALEESRRLEAVIRRLNAQRLLRCQVALACWGTQPSEAAGFLETALSALLAAVSPTDRKERLQTHRYRGKRAFSLLRKLASLGDTGKATLLLPEEAAPYFTFPAVDIGIPIGKPAHFPSLSATRTGVSTASAPTSTTQIPLGGAAAPPIPFKPGCIALGQPYRGGTLDTTRTHFLECEALRRHVAIVGITGTGKSTTKNRIVIDAWRNGIPSLLIEPVKTDARALLGAIPELRLFTLGNEGVAPFRLNPFHVMPGVPVQLHLSLLYTCFAAAWPLYGILANHMRRILTQTYLDQGWDPVTNTRGRPIQLEHFRATAQRYCDEVLQYSGRLTQDFRGALLARVEDLCDPSRAVIFNTSHNLPMEELLAKPTVIELKHLGDPNFTAFLVSLLLIMVYEYIDKLGPAEELRYLLVIDEAHRLLEELPKTLNTDEAAVAKRQAIDQLVNLIAEARSLGLGVVLAEQLPTRLARDALKNCSTKIVHRLTSPEDRLLMAQETGCTQEQAEHIAALRVGEAIVAEAAEVVPTNLQIYYDPAHHPQMTPTAWTDEQIRNHMATFYTSHPAFAQRPPVPSFSQLPLSSQTEASPVRVQPPNRRIKAIVQTPRFQRHIRRALAIAERDPNDHPLEKVLAFYATALANGTADPLLTAKHLYAEVQRCFGPRPLENEVLRTLITHLQAHYSKALHLKGGTTHA